MKQTPPSVCAAHVLILINAAFWLVFAILAAIGALPSFPSIGAIRWVMAILALGTCVALGSLVVLLRRRKRSAFYLALAALSVIAVLSLTDQVGLPDLLTFATSLSALALLLKDRAWHLPTRAKETEDQAV
jgi:hypothetical protein